MKDLWLLAALRIFGKNDRDIKRITAVMTSFFLFKVEKMEEVANLEEYGKAIHLYSFELRFVA